MAIAIVAGSNVRNVALVKTATGYRLCIVNYGWNTSATNQAVINAKPDMTINNSSVGPWKGNASILAFMNAGIPYFEYLDGGYEGTQARSIPNDLQSNIAFMVAAKNAGAYGIFLDEVSTNPNAASISYLTAIHNEALLLGLKTIFNTGYYVFDAATLKNLTDLLMADEDYTGNVPTSSEIAFGLSRIIVVNDQVATAANAISITKAAWINFGETWCTDSVSYALPSYMAAYIAGLG
jgi:hypothetical protein